MTGELGLFSGLFQKLRSRLLCETDITAEQTDQILLSFPEMETTNGKVGLLKFNKVDNLKTDTVVQPITIQVSRLFINNNNIYSGFWTNLFHLLSNPITIYKIK